MSWILNSPGVVEGERRKKQERLPGAKGKGSCSHPWACLEGEGGKVAPPRPSVGLSSRKAKQAGSRKNSPSPHWGPSICCRYTWKPPEGEGAQARKEQGYNLEKDQHSWVYSIKSVSVCYCVHTWPFIQYRQTSEIVQVQFQAATIMQMPQ